MTAIDSSSVAKLRAAIPEHMRHITGVGPTHALMQKMIREAHHGQRSVYLRTVGTRFANIVEDTWPGRGRTTGAILAALSNHAAGRALQAGYKHGLIVETGTSDYWSAHCTITDWPVVLLAALDYQATKESVLADWYLDSTCHISFCPRHDIPEVTPCGSGMCRTAMPHTRCSCTCRGATHGMGPAPEIPALVQLDWESMPTPVWPSVPAEVRLWNVGSHRKRFERPEFAR